jgi:hypothetical protein
MTTDTLMLARRSLLERVTVRGVAGYGLVRLFYTS